MNGFRNRLHPAYTVWLAIMWVILQGEPTWGNALAGLALGTLVVVVLPLPPVPRSGNKVRWGKLLRFAAEWSVDLILASIKVAWLAVRREDPPCSAILRVPMRVSSELVLYLSACAYNLQPGGTVSDIDIANREWTIHVLDAHREEDIQREINHVRKLEKQMIDIFETRS